MAFLYAFSIDFNIVDTLTWSLIISHWQVRPSHLYRAFSGAVTRMAEHITHTKKGVSGL